jgi:predicted permease
VSTRVRTPLIIVAIAALVWALPSGDDSARAIGNAFSAIILAAFVLLGVRLYRDHRGRIDVLGDTHRLMLYSGLGLIVVAFAANSSLVATGAGTLLFVVLLAAAALILYAVWQRWREVA